MEKRKEYSALVFNSEKRIWGNGIVYALSLLCDSKIILLKKYIRNYWCIPIEARLYLS